MILNLIQQRQYMYTQLGIKTQALCTCVQLKQDNWDTSAGDV
jgi:hypothetical protein